MPPSSPTRRPTAMAVALLGALIVAAYLPVFSAGFVWDDDITLVNNPLIRAAGGWLRFWTTTQPADYWPLTYTSLWLEWRLWGLHALGYHAVALALHLGACLLLWRLFARLRLPGAGFAALLFAVHPVNVESVAWIAQRKNLLALVFSVISVLAFVRDQKVGRDGPSRRAQPAGRAGPPYLWMSLGAFLLAMLSKGSAAPLPVVLAGLIAWRRPLRLADARTLAPFFGISAAFTGIDLWFQLHSAAGIIRSAGWAERICDAGLVPWFYLAKALLPVRLSFVYPPWAVDPGRAAAWLPLAATATLSLYLWRVYRNGRARAPFFAWGYFLLMLVPVMGLADVYFMKYSLVADHYQELALIGICGLVAERASVSFGLRPSFTKRLRVPLQVGLIALLGILTFRQCREYRDLKTLLTATLRVNPACWMAHNNLGILAYDRGDLAAATDHFRAALRLKPDFGEAANNLGNALLHSGHAPEAITRFREALRLNPRLEKARLNLGNALMQQNRAPEAMAEFETALRLDPGDAAAHNNLADAFLDSGHPAEAVPHYEAALRADPTQAFRHYNLALAFAQLGRRADAIREYQASLRLQPNFTAARQNLDLLLRSAPGPKNGL